MEQLSKACQCGVCLQTLILPMTWSCGHTFCKPCTATLVIEMTDERGRLKCPECRKFANRASIMRFATNSVLQSLLSHVFPRDVSAQREKEATNLFEKYRAQMKGPSATNGYHGENGGAHDRGWEVVLPEERFILRNSDVKGSRNVVRDEADYAMQLCLSAISSLKFIPFLEEITSWKIRFAVMEMEEDEAEDGGFPLSINESDDAEMDMALIRKSFEGSLKCIVSVDGKDIGNLESECEQGIGTFEIGTLFRGKNALLMHGKQVTVKVTEAESDCSFEFSFKLIRTKDAVGRPRHLLRVNKTKSGHEGEGESLDSDDDNDDLDAESDEDEERGSLDDFIVSDTTPTPKKSKRWQNDSEDDDEEVVNVDDDDDEEASSVQRSDEDDDVDEEEEAFIVAHNKLTKVQFIGSDSEDENNLSNNRSLDRKQQRSKSKPEEDRKTTKPKTSKQQTVILEESEEEFISPRKRHEPSPKTKKKPVVIEEEEEFGSPPLTSTTNGKAKKRPLVTEAEEEEEFETFGRKSRRTTDEEEEFESPMVVPLAKKKKKNQY